MRSRNAPPDFLALLPGRLGRRTISRPNIDARTKLEKEHDRLAKELDYKVPADVPAEPKR